MLALLASAALAASYTGTIGFHVPSNAPPAGQHVETGEKLGSSPASAAHAPGQLACSWAPLVAEITSDSGHPLWLRVKDRDSTNWGTVPSSATCSTTYGGDSYTLTVNLAGRTVPYAHLGQIGSFTTGADFAFGAGSLGHSGGGSWTQLPTFADYTAGTYAAVKTGGGAWTGVSCRVANAETGSLDAVLVSSSVSAAAGTGSCTLPRSGGASLVVPITLTR